MSGLHGVLSAGVPSSQQRRLSAVEDHINKFWSSRRTQVNTLCTMNENSIMAFSCLLTYSSFVGGTGVGFGRSHPVGSFQPSFWRCCSDNGACWGFSLVSLHGWSTGNFFSSAIFSLLLLWVTIRIFFAIFHIKFYEINFIFF